MARVKKEYIYKKVKVAMPHCKDCGEQLQGNNSHTYPYKCKCGTWKQDWYTMEYYIEAGDDK